MSRTQDAAPVTDLGSLTAGSFRLGRRIAPDRPQWWRAGAWMLGMQTYLALWFWAVVLLLAVVAVVALGQADAVGMSVLQFGAHGALWYPFSLMITVSAVQLTSHVGNGMTRRSFVRACLLATAWVGLVYGLAMAVGLAVEGALYDRAGWPQVHVATTGDDAAVRVAPWDEGFAVSAVTYAVRTAGGAVAGLLVGTAYYRLGALRGTLALPLTVLPAVAGQDDLAHVVADSLGISLAAYDLVNLAVTALAALAFWRLVRNIPVAHQRS
ncbi:hypothetical protein [Georgenia sp. SUBG003]|uniref:hypothetical protein n=1 Tax=Georgenia sp. SUBG003 TaxID=1497974 RepID=UPI0004D83A3B|nr:hypothetical protein DA06_08840 [Georgenia sp. SUBG003]